MISQEEARILLGNLDLIDREYEELRSDKARHDKEAVRLSCRRSEIQRRRNIAAAGVLHQGMVIIVTDGLNNGYHYSKSIDGKWFSGLYRNDNMYPEMYQMYLKEDGVIKHRISLRLHEKDSAIEIAKTWAAHGQLEGLVP